MPGNMIRCSNVLQPQMDANSDQTIGISNVTTDPIPAEDLMLSSPLTL